MLTPLTAQQTLDRARSALQSGRGAGMPELLKLIETLSTDLHKVTIGELVELIEKDVAVMTRVISVANTLAHNPGIKPLTSLTHAIHQIGFQRIRSLAVSLMLIENTGRDANPPEQRDAAAQALTAGLIAQGSARSLGMIDPELAFACATLRHFGQIMLPVVSLEHYREAVRESGGKPEDAALAGRFGLTPLELTKQLLSTARLPEEVMRSLSESSPESLDGIASQHDARLLGLADFSGRLARIALDGTVRSDGFDTQSHRLAHRYEKLLPGAVELIEPALLHTDLRLASFSRCNGVSSLPTAKLQRIHARVVRKNSPAPAAPVVLPAPSAAPVPEVAPVPAATTVAPDSPPTRSPSLPLPAPEVCWTEATIDAPAEEPAKPEKSETKADWPAALEEVRTTFGADECWVFLSQPGGQSLPLVGGTGENWKLHQARASLRLDERTVFGVCLSLRSNVVIHDTGEASLASYLPEWFRGAEQIPGAFVLVPLHNGVKSSGLVLVGWQRAQRLQLSPEKTETVRQLLAAANASARIAA